METESQYEPRTYAQLWMNEVGSAIPATIHQLVTKKIKGKGLARFYGLYDINESVLTKIKIMYHNGA